MRRMAIIALASALLPVVLPFSATEAAEVWGSFQPLRQNGNVIETLKHVITVGESGLPEQLVIKADRSSLPLEARDGGAVLNDEELKKIGRGSQLRSPMRLEATVDGNRTAAEVREAAAVANQSQAEITFKSRLNAGPLQADMQVRYECDGAMIFSVAYSGDAANVDVLELVMDIEGEVGLAYRGLPADFRAGDADFDMLDVSLPDDTETTVWSSRDEWIAGADGGFVRYLLFGSRDRAFTWIADDPAGFVLGDDTPMMLIERDRLGRATLRVRLIGRAGKLDGQKTAKFELLVHPSHPRPAGMRNTQWLNWHKAAAKADIDGVENATLGTREKLRDAARRGDSIILPALAAGAFESTAAGIELAGSAGADGVSPELDNMRLYPNSLFSVLAGPFRNLPTRIRSNVRDIVSGGVSANYDRQILGRALAADIGVAIEGFHQPVEFLRLAQTLKKFGFFDDDETEVLPYWRNSQYIRYGEQWSEDDAFALDAENPAEHVYVTVFRRRLERDGRKGFHAVFIVVNEGDKPARERLYILDPTRIFGGLNQITSTSAALDRDFSAIPEGSDWAPEKIRAMTSSHGRPALKNPRALRDMDNGGFVQHAVVQRYSPPPEIYGPLYIYPRDFRIVYGYWLAE